MTAIWQQRDGAWRLLAPGRFPDEATLHDRVEEAPQILPLAGSPQITVLGREVQLGSGRADLIAIEDSGRPVVIETKLASNAEARRAVVSQVLAYAAYLHGLTVDEFERDVLGDHLRRRSFESVALAVAATDQVGRIDPDTLTEALSANLEQGRFRLVFVLDDAPDELVRLVGYLEAVTPELVIDLITVSVYDVGGSAVLVPQRVDPERSESEALAPPGPGDGGRYIADGAADFIDRSRSAPEEGRGQLLRMSNWAVALDSEGLVGRLITYHGANGILTLLPRLSVDDAGLVTINYSDGGGYLQFWRPVFERRAPNTLPAVEAAAAPIQVGQGTAIHDVTEELLDLLTAAYREAVGNITG